MALLASSTPASCSRWCGRRAGRGRDRPPPTGWRSSASTARWTSVVPAARSGPPPTAFWGSWARCRGRRGPRVRHRRDDRQVATPPWPRRARAGRPPSSAARGRGRAALSSGFASLQRSSDRQPQPMHSVRPAFRRSSSSMRSSIRARPACSTAATSRGGSERGPAGSFAELGADLVEREPDPLREDDERDPPQHGPRDSGGGRSRPARRRSGRAPRRSAAPTPPRRCACAVSPMVSVVGHAGSEARPALDFKFT